MSFQKLYKRAKFFPSYPQYTLLCLFKDKQAASSFIHIPVEGISMFFYNSAIILLECTSRLSTVNEQ